MSNQSDSASIANQKRDALKIALLYLSVGSLWILFSDKLIAKITPDPAVFAIISIYKGWGYVAITALLLYWLISRNSAQRGQIEKTLHESEQSYQEFLDQMSDGFFMADASGRYTLVNQQACRLVSYSKAELLSMNLRELMAPDDLKSTPLRLAELQAGKNIISERKLIKKDGSYVLCEISGKMLPDGRLQSVVRDITERKQAEQQLRFQAAIIDSAEDAIDGKTIEGIILSWNPGAEKLYGYTATEVIGKSIMLISPPERPDDVAEILEQIRNGASIQHYETVRLAKDGRRIDISLTVSPIRDQTGKIVGASAISRDITARKRLEAELREQERKLNTLFEILPVGVSILDAEHKVVFGNPALQRILQMTQTGIANGAYKHRKYLTADGRPMPSAGFASAQAEKSGQAVQDVETGIVKEDGEIIWTNVSAVPVDFPDWKLVIVTAAFTAHKQAEEQLRASQKLLQDIIDNTSALVYVLDLDGRFLLLNHKLELLFGHKNSEMVGQPRKAFMPAEIAAQHRNNDLEIIQTGQGKIFEEENFEPDGRHVYLTTKFPLFDMHNNIYAVCGISTDMSQRKHIEEELQRSNTELEQFAYIASHDLQEPLRAVAGMVQLLQQRYQGQLDERADEYIGHAVEASGRMQTLINDLLELSRVGRLGRSFSTTDMEQTLKHALVNLQSTLQESQAEIAHDPLPTLLGDEIQLTQVLQNLIANALKFRGARPPHIHVSAEKIEQRWRFAVRDNGIGIEAQYFERIFLVFQRLHTRREYPGTGIGLALCKKIIERHGGQIWVESQPGQGSTFYFTIPER
ncbi:MAG: PAS domain S-box protein [Chloroflexota bacterium]